MTPRPDLKTRLARSAGITTKPALDEQPAPKVSYQGSTPAREGKVMIAGYFSAELARAVKIAAAEEGVTVQYLIGEGLDLVLRSRGKHAFDER